MLRIRSRIARGVVLGVASALALAGCAGGNGNTGSDDGGSATSGTVNWWSWTPDNNVAEREIAEFNKQYPDIKVIYKKVPGDNYAAVLKPALASNAGPDVYTVNASGAFSAEVFAPYAYDLTPDMEKLLGADWKTKVYDGGVKAFTVKDRLVAAQWAKVGAGIMWINKDMFDKYGLQPPKTLAEWESLCKTFRSKGQGCFREGMSGTSGFVVDTVHSIADSIQPGAWAAAGRAPGSGPTRNGASPRHTSHALQERHPRPGVGRYPAVPGREQRVPVREGADGADGHLVPAVHHGGQPHGRSRRAGVPADTPKITIVPIAFPDVAGKGNPTTMFTDPDAGRPSTQVQEPQRGHHLRPVARWHQGGPAGRREQHGLLRHPERGHASVGQIKLVNPTVQKPELEKTTESPAPRRLEKLRHPAR